MRISGNNPLSVILAKQCSLKRWKVMPKSAKLEKQIRYGL